MTYYQLKKLSFTWKIYFVTLKSDLDSDPDPSPLRIDIKSWIRIRIRIETNADPQNCFFEQHFLVNHILEYVSVIVSNVESFAHKAPVAFNCRLRFNGSIN